MENILTHLLVASVLCSAAVIIFGYLHHRSKMTTENKRAKLNHLLAISQDLRRQIKAATTMAELSEISFTIDGLADDFIDYVPQYELDQQLDSLRRLVGHKRIAITLYF